jgi:hypothetical protein
MKHLILLLLLLMPAFVVAETDGEATMRMTVKPMLCIIDKRTPQCQLAFLVVWESEQDGYYCLFNDFGDAPLRCWNDEREGRLNDERSVNESFSYWMTGDDSENRLAMIAVEVLRMDTDDRRRNRRTRHVWDIN